MPVGLDINDYYVSVVQNRHDLPLVDQSTNSWYCKLGKETGDEQYYYEEIVIVLCGDDQRVFAMLMTNQYLSQY